VDEVLRLRSETSGGERRNKKDRAESLMRRVVSRSRHTVPIRLSTFCYMIENIRSIIFAGETPQDGSLGPSSP
jgi:hypothetical protein